MEKLFQSLKKTGFQRQGVNHAEGSVKPGDVNGENVTQVRIKQLFGGNIDANFGVNPKPHI